MRKAITITTWRKSGLAYLKRLSKLDNWLLHYCVKLAASCKNSICTHSTNTKTKGFRIQLRDETSNKENLMPKLKRSHFFFFSTCFFSSYFCETERNILQQLNCRWLNIAMTKTFTFVVTQILVTTRIIWNAFYPRSESSFLAF